MRHPSETMRLMDGIGCWRGFPVSRQDERLAGKAAGHGWGYYFGRMGRPLGRPAFARVQVLEALTAHPGPHTKAEITRLVEVDSAQVSRHVDALLKKGIVRQVQELRVLSSATGDGPGRWKQGTRLMKVYFLA